jgi:hypothetical protein
MGLDQLLKPASIAAGSTTSISITNASPPFGPPWQCKRPVMLRQCDTHNVRQHIDPAKENKMSRYRRRQVLLYKMVSYIQALIFLGTFLAGPMVMLWIIYERR